MGRFWATIVLTVLLIAAGTVRAGQIKLVCSETSRGKFPRGINWRSVIVSPNAARVAYPLGSQGESYMVVDGVAGKRYKAQGKVVLGRPVFSSDSRRVVCWASVNGKRRLVVDGVESPPWDNIRGWVGGYHPGNRVFSPDCKRVAYVAYRQEERFAVIDGKVSKPYDSVRPIIFSADSRHVAYCAEVLGKYFIVRDGKEVPGRYDGAGDPVFSPDGRRMFHSARVGKERCLVVDGQRGPMFTRDIHNPHFSGDSSRIAYYAMRGYDGFAVVDGKEHRRWMRPTLSRTGSRLAYKYGQHVYLDGRKGKKRSFLVHPYLLFSDDASKLVYLADSDRSKYVVTNETDGKVYGLITNLQLTPRAGRVVYIAHLAHPKGLARFALVVDEVEQKAYKGLYQITFSPDGRRIVYVGERGDNQWVVVCDGIEKAPRQGAGGFVFSPDSRRLAYTVRQGERRCVVVDGKLHKPYTKIAAITFSPDSRHIAYLAWSDRGCFFVVDGVEADKAYQWFIAEKIVFDTPASFHTIAAREKELFLAGARIVPLQGGVK